MMTLSAPLRAALGSYDAVEKEAAAIGLRKDEARKQALVRARRRLAEQMGHLGSIIEQDADLAREPDKQRELSRTFAAMRYALVLHQANWPAVTIDDDPSAYRQSALGVQVKSDAFWTWCAAHLGIRREMLRP